MATKSAIETSLEQFLASFISGFKTNQETYLSNNKHDDIQKYCQCFSLFNIKPTRGKKRQTDRVDVVDRNQHGWKKLVPNMQQITESQGGLYFDLLCLEYIIPTGPGYQLIITYEDNFRRKWERSIGFEKEIKERTYGPVRV